MGIFGSKIETLGKYLPKKPEAKKVAPDKPKEQLPPKEEPGTTKRVAIAAEKLKEQAERLKSIELYPRVGIIADGSMIENQQIDIIKVLHEDTTHISFKLTEQYYEAIRTKITGQYQAAEESSWQQGKILYGKFGDPVNSFQFADCWQKRIGGITIKISRGVRNELDNVRSALGLVEIIIPDEEGANQDAKGAVDESVNRILAEELGITSGIAAPEKEAELDYKLARYKWHHIEETPPPGVEEKLVRKEVFPGYFTFVEEGKHREYQQKTPYAVYHSMNSINSLPKIIKAGGLISTHERYRRGLMHDGMSSIEDLMKGGGDNVFTRVLAKEHYSGSYGGILFVFKPELLDRTDWYTYNDDCYGSTDPNTFKSRLRPEELLERQKTNPNNANEQMFRTGISIEDIKAIACSDTKNIFSLLKILEQAEIEEINGKPLDQIIVFAPKFNDILKISNDQPIEAPTTVSQIIKEHKNRLVQNEVSKADLLLKYLYGLISKTSAIDELLKEKSFNSASYGFEDLFYSFGYAYDIHLNLKLLNTEQKTNLLEKMGEYFKSFSGFFQKLKDKKNYTKYKREIPKFYEYLVLFKSTEKFFQENIETIKKNLENQAPDTAKAA